MVKPKLMKPHSKVALILVFMVIAICIYSIVDWYVMAGYFGWGSEGEILPRYWIWMNVTILMFAVVSAVAFWAGAPMGKQTTQIVYGILISGVVLLISGLEDVMYFLINEGKLPADNKQWTWMAQYRAWGFWNTKTHLIWMSVWLFIVLPLLWILVYKSTRHYRISVSIRRGR